MHLGCVLVSISVAAQLPVFLVLCMSGTRTLETIFPKGVSMQLAQLAQVPFPLCIDRLKVLSLVVFSPDVEVYGLGARIYAPSPLPQLCF